MGVLNVTPDSFYAGGRAPTLEQALAQAERAITEGADVLDIGGESSRPGADEVREAEELARVLPVIEAIRKRWPKIPLSIDTRKAEVARQALASGVGLINDISAFRYDPQMANVVAKAQVPVILMHMQGTPRTMQMAPSYKDVVGEITRFFDERINFCRMHGIQQERIVLDPGIGFGKTLEHNQSLLAKLPELATLGRPLLIGVSRKSMIGRLQNGGSAAADAEDRLEGSIAAALYAVSRGAHGLRVHDVGATRRALNVWQALNEPTH